MIQRKKTKKVRVGNIYIGGDAPITVQTMVKVDAHDVRAVVRQIREQEEVGCDITRMNVLDMESVMNFSKIKKQIHIPIVADIHINYLWAIEAIKQGVDKLRINPGNIGGEEKVRKVVTLAKERGVPIRIGVNTGSLEKDLLEKYGHPTAEALVESAERHIKILEDLNFDQIIVALKATDAPMMIEAHRLFSQKYDYPVHLGVTEAGTPWSGTIKSSIGIGTLLAEGIGDTIRVSLTGDSKEEIRVGREILKSLGLRQSGPVLISCPTCSRTQIDLVKLANQVEEAIKDIKQPIKVAVMGCIVNGPGEAREADVGVAGGKEMGAIFVKGKIIKTVKEEEILPALLSEIKKLTD